MADTPKMYRVYSIVPRAKQDDYWLNIGVAFPHEDGQGLNVMLQSLPSPRVRANARSSFAPKMRKRTRTTRTPSSQLRRSHAEKMLYSSNARTRGPGTSGPHLMQLVAYCKTDV